MKRGALTCIAFMASALFAENALADRITVIREPNGDKTVVRTDNQGTTVTRNGQGVYTSGGDRHQDQVDYSTKQGGQVVRERTR